MNIPRGKNYAPTKPLIDLRDRQAHEKLPTHDLTKQLRDKYSDLMGRDKSFWRETINAQQIVANFIAGNQVLEFNPFDYSIRPVKADKNPNTIRAINLMQYYTTNFLTKWGESNPDIYLSPLSNADQAVSQAKKANSVVDYLETNWYNPFFSFQEALQAWTAGWYARQVEPDFTAKSFHALYQVIEEKQIPIGKGYGTCGDCGYSGDKEPVQMNIGNGMPGCPECKSIAFNYEPPAMMLWKDVAKEEKIFLPEIVCNQLQLASTRFDIKRRCEDSGWMITEKSLEKGVLRRMLGDLKIPEGESGNDFGLKAMSEIAKIGAAVSGKSDASKSQDNDREFIFSKMYLSPDDMEDIRFGQNEKTVSGEKIEKKKKMCELFPDGACVVGVNGMQMIIGIFPDHHSKSVTSGVFHMKVGSGVGRGATDPVEISKQFNRRNRQIDKFFDSRSTPATLYMEGAIKPEHRKLLGRPEVNIPVQLQNFPEVRTLDQIIRPMQGESVPGDLVNHTYSTLRGLFEVTSHITDFSGGASPSVDNDTATGAQILDANANAIFSPALSLKADVAKGTAKKGFYLWCEHTPVSRFIPFKSKTKAGSFGIEVKGEEVKGEYNWQITPGSEQPKNAFHKLRQRNAFFAQFQGGVIGWLQAKAQFPEQVAELERDADLDFASDNYDVLGEGCRMRYERAKEQLTENPDFMGILYNLEPSLEIGEANLTEKRIWFQNLLDSEEGWNAPTIERKLIGAFIEAFQMLAKGQAIVAGQDATEVQVKSQQPAVDAQNAQQQAQAEAQAQAQGIQNQQQNAQNEQNLMIDAAKTINDNEQAEAERAHQAQQAVNQQRTDIAVAALNAAGKEKANV